MRGKHKGGLNSRWISVVKRMVDPNDGKRDVYLDRNKASVFHHL